MRSTKSFFNRGLARNMLRRFWPLWVLFAVIFLLFPITLRERLLFDRGYYPSTFTELYFVKRFLMNDLTTLVCLSPFLSCGAALSAFSFLYQPRTCGLIASLPIRRESVFTTYTLTAALSLLLPLAVSSLCMLLEVASYGAEAIRAVGSFFGVGALALLAFLNLAVFCAQLTGSFLIMPTVYLILNMAAGVLDYAVSVTLSLLVYGLPKQSGKLLFLSPLLAVFESNFHVDAGTQGYPLVLGGLSYLIGFFVVSLALLLGALLLFRRRRMEGVQDTIVIPVLRPIFLVCMSIGTAFVSIMTVFGEFLRLQQSFFGFARYAAVAVFALLGAVVGWIVGEMIVRRSLRVFHRPSRLLLAVLALIAAFLTAAEFDVFGLETRIPAAEEIVSVSIGETFGGPQELKGAEGISLVLKAQETLLENKHRAETGSSSIRNVSFHYSLRDGSTFDRIYEVPAELCGELLLPLEEAYNCREAILDRLSLMDGVSLDCITDMSVEGFDALGEWASESYPADEARHFYEQCVLPDALDGNLVKRYPASVDEEAQDILDVTIRIYYRVDRPGSDTPAVTYAVTEGTAVDDKWTDSIWIRVNRNAVRVMAWLKENSSVVLAG